MEKTSNHDYILNILDAFARGDYQKRGELSDDPGDHEFNDIVLGLNNLGKELSHQYGNAAETENKINEILDVIMAFAAQEFSREINIHSRSNTLFPIVKGINLLGRELQNNVVKRNHYDALIKALPEVMIFTDKEGSIRECNEHTCKVLGYTMGELLEMNIRAIFRDAYLLFQGDLWKQLMRYGVVRELEKDFIRSDASRVPFSVCVGAVKSQRDIIEGYLYLARDMTDLRHSQKILNLRMKQLAEARSAALNMMEDANEANRSKTVFLTNMSHELRTPMSAIIGISQIISASAENLTGEQREGLDIINQSGKRLLALINDILDLSKIEVGKMELEYSQFSLLDMITNLEKITWNLVDRSRLEVITQIDSRVPEMIISDEKKLNQILLNILGNAAKFTDQGSIILRTYMKEGSLYFEVTDTGIGIKKEDVQFIFDEFKQLDGSMSRKYQGTGLGLSLSRKMVQLLGGRISAESELRKGTTLRFYIPIKNKHDVELTEEHLGPGEEKTMAPQEWNKNEKPLILVVDDEDICVFTFRMMLKQHYNLVFARNGREAVEKYLALRPRAVLMDIMMPEMDGYTTFRELREKDRENNAPVIAVTARAMEEDRDRILKFGFTDYISKPFDLKLLLGILGKYVK